jgi:hypothetical protein
MLDFFGICPKRCREPCHDFGQDRRVGVSLERTDHPSKMPLTDAPQIGWRPCGGRTCTLRANGVPGAATGLPTSVWPRARTDNKRRQRALSNACTKRELKLPTMSHAAQRAISAGNQVHQVAGTTDNPTTKPLAGG